MKKILLLIALVASPVFAQEEEQEVQIEIETGGGVEVGVSGQGSGAIVAFPDKSVWVIAINRDRQRYCWIDENDEPRCKRVRVEDFMLTNQENNND